MERKLHRFWFGAILEKEGALEAKSYSESSNQRAKNLRSQIAQMDNVKSLTPIVRPRDTDLPMQFKIIIKGGKDGK